MTQSIRYKMAHKKDFGKEKIEILYEDSYLMILLKPSGILSAPYPGSRAKTVLDIVELIMRKKGSYSKNHKPLIVHRLDRDTSGVMMLAMTEAAQKKIMDSWHQMVTERLYRAVAENPRSGRCEPLPESGIIDSPLAYNSHNIGFVPSENAKPRASALKIKRRSIKAEKDGILSRRGNRETSIYERNLE
nr:RluA family pseudouridine synthase [Treponema sp.]